MSPKAVALLAYLAVTGQPHAREVLATLLWPELDAEAARNGLRHELSGLRTARGADLIHADRRYIARNAEAALRQGLQLCQPGAARRPRRSRWARSCSWCFAAA